MLYFNFIKESEGIDHTEGQLKQFESKQCITWVITSLMKLKKFLKMKKLTLKRNLDGYIRKTFKQSMQKR